MTEYEMLVLEKQLLDEEALADLPEAQRAQPMEVAREVAQDDHRTDDQAMDEVQAVAQDDHRTDDQAMDELLEVVREVAQGDHQADDQVTEVAEHPISTLAPTATDPLYLDLRLKVLLNL